MAKKTVKKAVSTKSKTVKKSAKKAVKKAIKKVTKKVAKKPSKKVAKKGSKKVLKKAIKKIPAKKVTKKVAKKIAKKPATKKGEFKFSDFSNNGNLILGHNFLFTGTLVGMQRKEAEQKVNELGGWVIKSVDKRLDYLVVGEKAGSKLKAAQKIPSVKIIDEETFKSMYSNIRKDSQPKEVKTDVYRMDFHVHGYGKENCVAEMTDVQYRYWKSKFAQEGSEAKSELQDHLWNFEYDAEPEDTHFGKWHDQDGIIHDEKAYYSDSSILNVTVYKNGENVEKISIPVTDKKLKKSFYDEFVPSKKDNKGKGYLHVGSVDRGGYSEGSFELEPGEIFDRKELSICVGKIFGEQFVWDVCYGVYGCLDDDGCQSSTGKGFDVDVYFF